MTITFRVARHSVRPGKQLVEILQDGRVVGAIYPNQEGDGITVVSAHFSEKDLPKDFDGQVIEDDGRDSSPPIPSVRITFKPRKYIIRRGKIKYLE